MLDNLLLTILIAAAASLITNLIIEFCFRERMVAYWHKRLIKKELHRDTPKNTTE